MDDRMVSNDSPGVECPHDPTGSIALPFQTKVVR